MSSFSGVSLKRGSTVHVFVLVVQIQLKFYTSNIYLDKIGLDAWVDYVAIGTNSLTCLYLLSVS